MRELRPLRVLHVEDSDDDSTLILRELRRAGFDPTCERVDTQGAFDTALRTKDWDVIISDFSLPTFDGLRALEATRSSRKDIPFILVSGTIGEDIAVSAMRAGAQDYVLKGALGRLPLAIERELREAKGRAKQRLMGEQLAISARMASAGVLAAGVAHEINNPLAVVTANLEFVSDVVKKLAANVDVGGRLDDVDAPLRDARDAVQRITGIVRDLKLFSRAHDEERDAVDVHGVIESSIRLAWTEVRHRAQLVRDFGDVPLVDSNAARLGQILLNLIVNAAQSVPEGRASHNEIRIATRRAEDGWVVIEVRDTGVGIPAQDLARIFDPFFTTKPAGVGVGLGLSLCQRMVADLGGHIKVESEVGKGTLFRLTLPVATRAPLPPPQAKPVQQAGRRARVLVIDDEVALGRALGRGLGKQHDVVVVTSGKQALLLIAAGERFDVILSDLMMPEVTGMEIHESLSQAAPDQAKRMMFLTGGAFTERSREFLDAVPNVRIDKPFEMTNLLAIVAGVAPRG